MALTVGIVGATGAVGKEVKECLETRKFPVEKLRIFGSERSAGKSVETDFGTVTVELFDVAKARECDVVFLAVSGDFALEHAKAISEGDDGAVCIDNSVSVGNLFSSAFLPGMRFPDLLCSAMLFLLHPSSRPFDTTRTFPSSSPKSTDKRPKRANSLLTPTAPQRSLSWHFGRYISCLA